MDEYKLFLDKVNNFQCKLELEGASLDNAVARLVLEGRHRSYLYTGKIFESGQCNINIEKLGEVFKSGEAGTMRLEIIADDAYFAPWESEFVVDSAKKVRVEVAMPTKEAAKPTIKVNAVVSNQQERKAAKPTQITEQRKEFNGIVKSVVSELKKGGITSTNVKSKKSAVTKSLTEAMLGCSHKHKVSDLISNIVKSL